MTASEIETAAVSETADPARFVVAVRHGVLARLVDAVLAGVPFLALTGPSGTGKTTLAAAVRELLAARSVAARRIVKSDGGAIRLRTMAAQLLGKSEDAIDSGDVERLFDVMTVHRSSAQRHVIIVDDAELLHAEVLAYLRLLRSIGIEQVPQFLFVGGPSFWTGTADAAADVRNLITVRVDLEPLTAAESREFAELLLASSGRRAETAFDKAGFERLVHASDGRIGRLVSLLPGVAATSGEVSGEHMADPAVASAETGEMSRSENDADRLPDDAVPFQEGFDPEVAAALFGSPSAGHGVARSYRVPVLAGVVGAVMLAGMVGAVAYREISVAVDPGTQAEPVMTIEASSDSIHAASPVAVAVAQSEPGFGIVQSAKAARSDPGADVVQTASATATPEAVTPPTQPDAAATAASPTVSSPVAGLPGDARSSVLPVVLADDVAAPSTAGAGDSPLAGAASPLSTQPVSTSPQAATVLLPTAGAADTDAPTTPATAEPAAPSQATQTEAPAFVPQPPATPSAEADTVHTEAAGPSVVTQPAAPSPAGENTVPLPAISSPSASSQATDVRGADADPGATIDHPSAPSSAAQSVPPVAPPPATPSNAVDTAGSDTGSSAAGARPSASLSAPSGPVPPMITAPDAAPASDTAATAAPAIPAATQPAAAPPAAHPQTAANAVPAGTSPSNAPAATSASSRFPPPDLESLLSRGEAMLALGDISAARLLYERAASIGSARAATALGKTYDPAFLTSILVSGLAPNRSAAVLWYRKGAEMGDAEAADRLARLTAAP